MSNHPASRRLTASEYSTRRACHRDPHDDHRSAGPIEPYGWTSTLHPELGEPSRGCGLLAITRHDYAADHTLDYAIDGPIVTGYRLRQPHGRHGCHPDRFTAVPRAFALAAKITGMSFTPDMLDRPLLVGPHRENSRILTACSPGRHCTSRNGFE
ncbi:hypothetical protein [Nocardia sp. NPDC052566]|uniref:hypothetical protein n=1 Tax=Nocardia sp. NPDC052566 TaxID=3364330 RepID=UPI0037CB11F4